jgi:transcription termination/antitermination protein NusG
LILEVTGRSYILTMTITNSPDVVSRADLLPTAELGLSMLFAEYSTPYWYAIYTKPRHEKRVAEQLIQKSVETLLPVYECIRRWKNGRHRVHFPLFPGYAFVRIALKDRLDVIKVPGVIRIVGSDRGPLPLANEEIEGLQQGLAAGIDVLPHPYLAAGRRVRVVSGPLRGMRGIMIRRKGNYRIVVSLDLIMQSMMADVDIADVRPDEDVSRR